MECSDLRDEMLEVLYGEADAPTRGRVEEHHARCEACREEMAALRRLRRDLAGWGLPDTRPTRLRVPSWRGLPRGLAAAAAVLLALGASLGLSGSEVRFEDGRFAFRLGRGEDVSRLLSEQEARHREELRALRGSLVAPRDDEAELRRVRELIRESEARQAVLLSASLAELGERTQAQRRYDLARVSAGLSYLDGRTGEQVARTTELMGYVLRASQQQR